MRGSLGFCWISPRGGAAPSFRKFFFSSSSHLRVSPPSCSPLRTSFVLPISLLFSLRPRVLITSSAHPLAHSYTTPRRRRSTTFRSQGILGPDELTNLAGLVRDMDVQHRQKLVMKHWAEQKGEATVAALAASGALPLGPPGVTPPGPPGVAPPGPHVARTVSYTHLTLPTILLV